MDFRFVPKNLIMAKNEIVAKHTGIGEVAPVATDFSLMKMIKRLASLNQREAEKEALVVTKKELEAIARYLPHNYYKVRMDSLFLIFRLRANKNINWILFYEWQNAYDNQECNEFLKGFTIESTDFKSIMQECHFTAQKFKGFLSEKNIPIAYGKEALTVKGINSNKLNAQLAYLGIKETSKLAEDCNFLFFVFCEANAYFTVGEQEVLNTVKKYDETTKKLFLYNFLGKLTLINLKNFNRIAEYFLELTGENHTEKFDSFFVAFDPVLIRKYVDWIHIYKINKIFGNDERSLFWEQYHHDLVTKYAYSNSVVMEFNAYVAVEFLGQAMGPLYIYKKEYFDSIVRNAFKMRRYDNNELRQYLLKNTRYQNGAKILREETGTRLVHSKGWQYSFNNVLLRNGITERIL